MKHTLATALAFITLAAAALTTPAAMAATPTSSIETTLMFVLEADGSTDQGVIISSSDETINKSNCKAFGDFEAEFKQKDGKNKCLLSTHRTIDELSSSWIKNVEGNEIKFSFTGISFDFVYKVATRFGFDTNALNITQSVAAIPLNATVTIERLQPKVTKGSNYVYYTWEGDTTETMGAGLVGTIPISNPTATPDASYAKEPAHTDNPNDNFSSNAASPTVLATKQNSNNSNTALYVVLVVVSVVALAGIALTVLLVQKRKKPAFPPYQPGSPITPYNSQPYSSLSPQSEQTYLPMQPHQNQPGQPNQHPDITKPTT